MKIALPSPFSYAHCLAYLGRSEREILHRIIDSRIRKLIQLEDQLVLVEICLEGDEFLSINCLNISPSTAQEQQLTEYITKWLDLQTDLQLFYVNVSSDTIFQEVIPQLRGLRLIKVNDLFEAISWAIIGQQINLPFAYQIKQNLVLAYGKSLQFEGENYYVFPPPQSILNAPEQTLRDLKCSRQKVRYLKVAAEAILSGSLRKEELISLGYDQARKQLISLKGIGNWSANYVLMRCLGFRNGFPIEDAGLHQALRLHHGLDHKPSMEEVRALTQSWTDWQAYRTFYLWQSLGIS